MFATDIDQWREGVAGGIQFLREHYEDDLGLDFSADTMEWVESFLGEEFETPEAMDEESAQVMIDGLVCYVGEMLLRVGGGGWREPGRPTYQDFPVVVADPVLGLDPVAPSELLLATVRGERTEPIQETYAAWRRAVDAYQREQPSWSPAKEPTPNLEPVPGRGEADARYLRDWLAAREAAFPDWVATYGVGVAWDFSPESLDALGALVMRVTPTLEALHGREHAAFVDGASWYVGEALRRVKGGAWHFEAGDPEEGVYLGWPYVRQPPPYDWAAVPMRALRKLLKDGDPHKLRKRYQDFANA